MVITIATSIKYGNYKNIKYWTEAMIQLVRDYMPAFKAEFDFYEDVSIHFRPIRGITFGLAYKDERKIEIDPRQVPREVIKLVAHELVHCEQFKQDRLVPTLVSNRWIDHWEGKTYNPPRSYEEYINLPWEKEAHARAEDFVQRYYNTSNAHESSNALRFDQTLY
jgi:hypothetical protein